MVDKFSQKLSLWKNKVLSLAERVCLINSIYSSFPLFFFKLPNIVGKKIISLQRKFLWGGAKDKRKVA